MSHQPSQDEIHHFSCDQKINRTQYIVSVVVMSILLTKQQQTICL